MIRSDKKRYTADLLLLLTAMIWGLGFFFQKVAAETTSPFAFNALRYLIAALVLLAAMLYQLFRPYKEATTLIEK